MLRSEENAAQRGRQDIRKDIHESELRIRQDIRSSEGKLAGITSGIVDQFGKPLRSEASQTEDLAETIKVAAQPSMLGMSKNVANATRSLGSFTRGISTDGAVDPAKLDRLKTILDEDNNLKVDFDKYIQAARKIAGAGDKFDKNKPPGQGQLEQLNRSREVLQRTGKFDMFDKDFLSPRSTIGSNIINMREYAGGARFDPTASQQFAASIADVQRAIGLKNDSITREEERWKLFGDTRESVKGKVFTSKGFGIDTEADKERGLFKKMLEKLEGIEAGVGGTTGGSIGKLLAALAVGGAVSTLWNKNISDVQKAIGYDPETGTYNPLDADTTGGLKLGTATTASLVEKGLMSLGGPNAITAAEFTAKTGLKLTEGTVNMLKSNPDLAINSAGKVYNKATGQFVEQSADNIAKAAGKEVLEDATKETAERVAKEGAEAGIKAAVKKVPVVGFLAGLGFGAYRLLQGDVTGAGLEVASGTASIFAGPGTVASVGIDATLLGMDIARMDYDKLKEEGAFTKNLRNWDMSNELSTIDRDYKWDSRSAATILEMERDDLSAEDIAFLEGFLSSVENAGRNNMGQAVDNTLTEAELVAKKNMELVMTNSNNTFINNLASNQGTEVVGVAERAGPTSSNHSWQRFQDRVFI